MKITNEILDRYIYETLGGIELGVNFPDDTDSVMGYYKTREEARGKLKDWYIENVEFGTELIFEA